METQDKPFSPAMVSLGPSTTSYGLKAGGEKGEVRGSRPPKTSSSDTVDTFRWRDSAGSRSDAPPTGVELPSPIILVSDWATKGLEVGREEANSCAMMERRFSKLLSESESG